MSNLPPVEFPGVGNLELDIVVFMLTSITVFTHIFFLPYVFKVDTGLGIARLLRMCGWIILGSRYAYLLFTTGDILISIPATVAVIFLTTGEIVSLIKRGKLEGY